MAIKQEVTNINVAQAKEMLGMVECEKGELAHIRISGKAYKFTNNSRNRPYRRSLSERYAEDILIGRWAGMKNSKSKTVNGEPLIIDKDKQIASGAHRLAALIIAEYKRRDDPKYYKETYGIGPLKLPTALTTGIDPQAADTIDMGQKRVGGDVLYRQEDLYEEYSPTMRKKMCNWLATAARLCWLRTGGKQVSDAPHLPHSELLCFIDDHPRLVKVIEFIVGVEKRTSGGFKELKISQAYMAGLAYLASQTIEDTDEEKNRLAQWVESIASGENLKRGQSAYELRSLYTKQLTQTGSRDRDNDVVGPWIKAWQCYCNGDKTTAGRLKVKKDEIPQFDGVDYVAPVEETEETAVAEE